MGINKSLNAAKIAVQWNGEQAAEVRGLTPTDVGTIISVHGEDIFEAFASLDGIDEMRTGTTDEVADKILAKAPAMISGIANTAPRMMAFIIALAADDADAVDDVAQWPLPLQFECLVQVAKQTFVGPEGFRLFVGNVQALIGAIGAMTNAKPKRETMESEPTAPAAAYAGLANGSEQS